MRNKFLFPILLLFLFFCFFVFYKSLNNSNIYIPKTNSKKILPVFKAKELSSNTFIPSKKIFLEDKYYIVNIWASWCLPCRDEHDYLLKLKKINNIEVIGINYKDKKSNAVKFLTDLGNPYSEVLIDLDGTKSIELGAIGVPESYLVNNKNKEILKKYIGPIDNKKFKEILKILKNEKN